MQRQAHGFPIFCGGPVGTVCRGFSEETLVPTLPSPTTPSRTLVVVSLGPRSCPGEDTRKASPPPGPTSPPPARRKATAGSAQGEGLSCAFL